VTADLEPVQSKQAEILFRSEVECGAARCSSSRIKILRIKIDEREKKTLQLIKTFIE
jgi:hypothetical protein